MLPWLKAQLAVLLTLWLQPSGKMEGTTQNATQNVTLHDFYCGN